MDIVLVIAPYSVGNVEGWKSGATKALDVASFLGKQFEVLKGPFLDTDTPLEGDSDPNPIPVENNMFYAPARAVVVIRSYGQDLKLADLAIETGVDIYTSRHIEHDWSINDKACRDLLNGTGRPSAVYIHDWLNGLWTHYCYTGISTFLSDGEWDRYEID